MAGIFSGVRAEFNQQLFQNLATQVITAGIDLRRREIYEQIVLNGQRKEIAVYNVQAAVKDALYYHAQCSVIAGFEVAKDSIKLIEDPGIVAANRVLAKLVITEKLLNKKALSDEEKASLTSPTGTLLLAGTNLKLRFDEELPITALTTAAREIERGVVAFEIFINELNLPKGEKSKRPTPETLMKFEQQKKKIIETAKAAGKAAGKALEKYRSSALGLTRRILAAREAVSAAGEDKQLLAIRTAELEKVRLEGRQKSREIASEQEKLSIDLAEARALLLAAMEKLNVGQTLKDETLNTVNSAFDVAAAQKGPPKVTEKPLAPPKQ